MNHIIRPIFGLRMSARMERLALLVLAVAAVIFMPHTPDGLAALGTALGGVIGAIIDSQEVLSDAQALTATAVSTNTYDMVAAGLDDAIGEPMAVTFTTDVAAKTSNADETYQVTLVQSANADLSSPDVLIATDTTFLSRAKFVKGFRFHLPIPQGLITKRYFGVRYVLGGTAPTWTVTAELQPLQMVQNEKVYPANFVISS